MVDSVEALGAAGVPRDHDQLTGAGAARAPAEPVGHLRGLPILVETKKGDVEAVARELKIVAVAAEEGDRYLRGHNETDIVVALVAVEMVLAAAIEHDHLTVEACFFFRFLLDGGALRPAGLLCGAGVRGIAADFFHAGRHILDFPEDVDLGIGAFELLLAAPGEEPILEVIFISCAQLLQDVLDDMVIGHHQAIGRNNRT